MTDRSADEASVAPLRSLSGSGEHPVVLPPPAPATQKQRKPRKPRQQRPSQQRQSKAKTEAQPGKKAVAFAPSSPPSPLAQVQPSPSRPVRRPRMARLRLTHIDPWSVTKMSFLLSIAIGVVTIVAVAIVWGVLGATGLWDSINSSVQDTLGDSSGSPFEIQQYLGASRVIGFTMVVAVIDVVLITMIATLSAFLYNLAATLLGGVEVTFTEDN